MSERFVGYINLTEFLKWSAKQICAALIEEDLTGSGMTVQIKQLILLLSSDEGHGTTGYFRCKLGQSEWVNGDRFPFDPKKTKIANAKVREAFNAVVKHLEEDHHPRTIRHAVVAAPKDLRWLEGETPDFLSYNKDHNCYEPAEPAIA